MAGTTLNNSAVIAQDTTLGGLVTQHLVRSDLAFGRIPWVLAPSQKFKQIVLSEPDGAAATRYDTAYSPSALSAYEYEAFLNYVQKSDSRLRQFELTPAGDGGFSDREAKKRVCIIDCSKKVRRYGWAGAPCGTPAIGADLTTLGITAVTPGPRHLTFEDVQGSTAVSTALGKFKWDNSEKTLQYKAPGDSDYGTAVTLSATAFHRQMLYSSNPGKWVEVTVVWATITGQADFESDATAAKCVTYTPSTQPTGLINYISPELRRFGNLSTSNPTATGDALSQENMSWLADKLLDSSGERPDECCIIMPENCYRKAQTLIAGLTSGGNTADKFMGTAYNGLSFRGIPIFRNPFIASNNTAANTSTTGLCDVYGFYLNEEGAHIRYAGGADVTDNQVSDKSDVNTPVGDDSGRPAPMPITYYESRAADSNLIYMVSDCTFEPVFGSLTAGAMLKDITQ